MTPMGFHQERDFLACEKIKSRSFPGNLVEIDNPEAVNFPNLTMFQPAHLFP